MAREERNVDPISAALSVSPHRWGFFVDSLLDRARQEWSAPGESPIPYLARLLDRAEDSIAMVCGELRPPLVQDPVIIGLFSQKLLQGVKVEIVFDKRHATSPPEAEFLVNQENHGLFDLKLKHGRSLRLHWTPDQPTLDFTVVDSLHALVERPDEEKQHGVPPANVVRYDDRKLASVLLTRFEKTRDHHTQELFKQE